MASNEGNWGPAILGLTIAFLALVILFLFLRIVTRIWIVHAFWWDDFTIILAVLGTTIGAGLDFVEVYYGFGRHEQFLSAHHVQEFRKYTYGEWVQTFATLMWTKVSICLFLMRIPRNTSALLRPLQLAVAFLLFSNTILTVMWIMQCQPIHAAWDNDGRCLSRDAKEGIILVQAIISVVSDFSFAAFPILILWRVQIDFKTKVGLWLLMCLGFITGACCLVRTVLNNQSIPLDETYDGIVNWVWRLFEVQVGIIAACIPTLRPLYIWLARRWRHERTGLDENVRFPLSNKPESWVEHADRGRDHSRSGEHGGKTSRSDHADAMRDELVREGIISTEDESIVASSCPLRVHPEDIEMKQEMERYGVS